jgi:cardiolipin synthase
MAAPSHSSIRARQNVQPAPSYGHLLNLPNFLTLCRIGSIPIFLIFLTRQRYTEALFVFAAAAVTDGLDGAVARWFDSRTELGAFLDPFADKLMLVSAFVVLTIDGELPGYLLSVVMIRDIVIVVGYLMISFFTGERVPVRPSYLGKLSTVMQLACVIGVLARAGNYWPGHFNALLIATVAVTAASFVHYMYRGLVWLRSREPQMFE